MLTTSRPTFAGLQHVGELFDVGRRWLAFVGRGTRVAGRRRVFEAQVPGQIFGDRFRGGIGFAIRLAFGLRDFSGDLVFLGTPLLVQLVEIGLAVGLCALVCPGDGLCDRFAHRHREPDVRVAAILDATDLRRVDDLRFGGLRGFDGP